MIQMIQTICLKCVYQAHGKTSDEVVGIFASFFFFFFFSCSLELAGVLCCGIPLLYGYCTSMSGDVRTLLGVHIVTETFLKFPDGGRGDVSFFRLREGCSLAGLCSCVRAWRPGGDHPPCLVPSQRISFVASVSVVDFVCGDRRADRCLIFAVCI